MSKGISILIIEDEEQLRELLEYNLSLEGFNVHLAGDGLKGIELAKKKKLDVILLDWMMYGMDGLETLSRLKNNNKTEDIPVFMMTAKGKMSDIDRAFEIGADDYITKPFKVMQLGGVIKRKLEKVTSAGVS